MRAQIYAYSDRRSDLIIDLNTFIGMFWTLVKILPISLASVVFVFTISWTKSLFKIEGNWYLNVNLIYSCANFGVANLGFWKEYALFPLEYPVQSILGDCYVLDYGKIQITSYNCILFACNRVRLLLHRESYPTVTARKIC